MFANRWVALALFFFTRISLGFQFQAVGSTAPFLIDDLGLQFMQIGTLVGLYLLPGVVVAVPGGLLGRRFGDKRVVLYGMGLMIAGGIVAGVAASYWTLVAGRLISGTGAAFLVVLMSKMIADWFTGKELVLGMSIYIVGWPAGIALGQAVQSEIAESHGWRATFHLTAVLVLLAWIMITGFYRDAPSTSAVVNGAGKLRGRKLQVICIAGAIWMLVNGSYLVLLTFGPTLLIERGASIGGAASTVSLMSWISMVVLPLGAYVSSRYKMADLIMFAGLLVSVVVALSIPMSSQPTAAFLLFGFAYSLALPVVAALPARLLAPHDRSLGFGIYWAWFYGGIPLLTGFAGLLRDQSNTAARPVIFSAVILMFALVLLLWLRRQHPAEESPP
jgi:predicted MFS family arabinose efflux permease